MCPGMKIIWALFICAQLGKYKKEVFLTKDLLFEIRTDLIPFGKQAFL